ncbi:MAG: GNAT family N-acetyltransferase [Natronospirillum sp.]|uniref:GNAT family N-acetyltransferase n=1 Tax=Natronospirillum sp. TaxID=2812955 RepID=UPI0025CF5C3B|nr:GNAT family N-acetyltransferase [Natronospirillum sp.]MCH8551411.1 GNAT family N-acetyltransferase [Natronospirillum sp.]
MNYQISEVQEHEKESLVQLRISAMRESLEAIGRFDPARARGRFLDAFDREATRKIEIDGQLIGFYVLKDKGDHLYLDHLYVHPDFQGQGLGASALAPIIELAQDRQLPLRLCALRGSRSNSFYLSHGFVQTGESEWDLFYEYRVC